MKVRKLINGVKCVVVPLVGSKTVTVEVFVKIGSKYEVTGEHGLSHFLEHMAFKGTFKRPSATMINEEIDSRGADFNAETGLELTSYYIKTVKSNLDWAIELLSDIVLNPVIDKDEVIREKGVIIEELKMYRDNPAMGLSDEFYDYYFGNSPIGCWSVGGKPEEITKYTSDDINRFRYRYLQPDKIAVVIAGDIVKIKQVENLVEEYFGKYKNDRVCDLPKVKILTAMITEKKLLREVDQGHFCIGVRGINRKDKMRHALKCLEVILAGNTSSRLFNEIREKRGWAYYIHLIGTSFEESGLLAVQSGVSVDKMYKAMDLVETVMLKMKDTLTEDELVLAKQYLRGKVGLLMERSDFWSEYVGEKVILDDRFDNPEKELEQIDNVKLISVKDLAASLMREGNFRKIWVEPKKV